MNQSFYETIVKEKIKNLMDEGLNSQAYQRSRTPKSSIQRGRSKLVIKIVGIIWVLGILKFLLGV